MNKRRWFIALVGLGLAAFWILSIVLFLEWIKPRVYELAPGRTRRSFRIITGYDLPQTADDLRALLYSSREPAIFLRFKTDAEGISYILNTFGGPGVKLKKLDAETLKFMKASQQEVFIGWYHVQERLKVCLFDLDSIESGLLLDDAGDPDNRRPGYRILIDDQKNIVYIAAWIL